MKTLKSAKQGNVIVNQKWYTIGELNKLLIRHVIFRFDENYKEDYNQINGYDVLKNSKVRLFLEDVSELEVVYDRKYECYDTVAVLHDGTIIHVTL